MPARALALAVPVAFTGTALAQAPVQERTSLEQRVQRIERMIESNAMLQLLESVKALQREVRELRGEIEVQNHTLEQLERRQRELYADTDRRLQAVEGGAVAAAPAPAPAPVPRPSAPSPASAPRAPAPATGSDPPLAAASPPAPQPQATQIAPSDAEIAERDAYQSAFKLLKNARYDQAAESFRAFLGRYPSGRYADNAQYWLGETFYGMRRYGDAAREFETLLGRYPDSQKRPHAMLKLGYSQAELGDAGGARATLRALVERYPDSTAAGLARKRLDRLGG